MSLVADHPQRYEMSNELHARPFPQVSAPSMAAYLALKPAKHADGRDRGAEFAQLLRLLDRFGASHPQPGATHYFGQIGRHHLKWESHTEFVTYTIFGEGLSERPFEAGCFDVFPADWLAQVEAVRVTSILIRVERQAGDEGIAEKLGAWFVPESLAVSRVLDDQLVVATDFRIDGAGHMRMAVVARPETGPQRIGRVVQRLCEIETYKSMAMLGLARARGLLEVLAEAEGKLSEVVGEMAGDSSDAAQNLQVLLAVSARLEHTVAQSSFRFGATRAYEAIVTQRIEVLREARFGGRQTLAEFMMRRFDPAMRTVASTQARLEAMTGRAARAAELLRTRVDVERSEQNQALLASMDRRADLALRLQHTVEGLSVVAISYYAVSLALYVLGPLEYQLGISKAWLAAVTTPVVAALVWAGVRRIRKRLA